MTRRLLPGAITLLALLACGKEEPSAPSAAAATSTASETRNLASVINGATVIDRTAEASLDYSALAAFDSDPQTVWSTPPVNLQQTVTLALPATTRVEAVTIRTSTTRAARGVRTLEFSLSSDGIAFTPAVRLIVPKQTPGQSFPVAAADARFVRFKTIDTYGETEVIDVPSIEVHGRETQQFVSRSLAGDWTINEAAASFIQTGLRGRGIIRTDPPMFLDGAWHERTFRFLWTRGRKKGVGVLTLDSESRRLSGFWWFGEARRDWLGSALFGSKSDTATAFEPANVMKVFLARDRSVPLPQIVASNHDPAGNGSIISELRTLISENPAARFRITARDWTGATAEERQRIAQEQMTSFRRAFSERASGEPPNVSFLAVGEPDVSAKSDQPLSRLLMSRFVLEVDFPAR